MSAIQKNKGKMGRPMFVVVSNKVITDQCGNDGYPRFAKTLGRYYLKKRSAILAMKREAEKKRREVVASSVNDGCYCHFRDALKKASMSATEYADEKLVRQVDIGPSHESEFPRVASASFGVDNSYGSMEDLTEYEVFCWSVHQLSEAPEDEEDEEEEEEDDGDGDE